MRSSDYHDRFVTLNGGLIVPAPCYLLALELEGRGVTFARDGRDTLIVGPTHELTDTDRARIKVWKMHLLALVDHCAQSDSDAHLYRDHDPEAVHE